MQQEISLVDVGVSHPGAFLADLVFNPRDTETLQSHVSLPAFCGTVCEWLCYLACRTDRFGSGIPKGKELPSSIPICRRGDIYNRQRDDNMVFYKHYQPGSRRSGIYAERAAKQPYGCRKRNPSRARRVDP